MTIRLDDDVHANLTAVARAQGVTLSDLARRTLAEVLKQERSADDVGSTGYAPVPATMTTVQRQQLALLHRILARLVDGSGEDGDLDYQMEQAKIIEHGYVAQYDEVFYSIQAELPRRDADLVMDILEMFHFLEWSYGELSEAEREELGSSAARTVEFRGFDFNDRREGRLASYAQHLISQGKWESQAKYFDDDHDRGNSHFPSLAVYQRMLDEFTPIWHQKVRSHRTNGRGSYNLSVTEIGRVVDAAVHPDNRRAGASD
jgi:uncharacterized protein YfbU (UPF0304 family)